MIVNLRAVFKEQLEQLSAPVGIVWYLIRDDTKARLQVEKMAVNKLTAKEDIVKKFNSSKYQFEGKKHSMPIFREL